MADKSKIEWTEATWNPMAGCTPISPGCTHCYAATMARRLAAMGQTKYQGLAERRGKVDVFTGKLAWDAKALDAPLRWKKPRRIFVNSMSDLFHERMPDEWIDRVFAVMEKAQQHTFQILTKRADRMRNYAASSPMLPLPNVWLGVSAERQQEADERIPHLLATPAAVRWVSYEPALGPIDFSPWIMPSVAPRLDWIVAGGESGPDARPAHPDWFRAVRDQCSGAGVAFFFKQWGAWAPRNCDEPEPDTRYGEFHDGCFVESCLCDEGTGTVYRVGKRAAGRHLDGRTHDQFPEVRA